MKYIDFDLVLASREGGYHAQVLNPPAGQGSADFQLPFSEQELKIFRLEATQSRQGVDRLFRLGSQWRLCRAVPTYQLSHTYSLGRAGAGWLIDSVQHHNQPPAMQPCEE